MAVKLQFIELVLIVDIRLLQHSRKD